MFPNQGIHLADESHQSLGFQPLLALTKGLQVPHEVISHNAFGGEAFLSPGNGQNLSYPLGIQFWVGHLGPLTYFLPNGQAFG